MCECNQSTAPRSWTSIVSYLLATLLGFGLGFTTMGIIDHTNIFIQFDDRHTSMLYPWSAPAMSSHHLPWKTIGDRPRCGADSKAALRAGCRFDIMASSWYPLECFNAEVLEQMLEEVSFQWVRNDRRLCLRLCTDHGAVSYYYR